MTSLTSRNSLGSRVPGPGFEPHLTAPAFSPRESQGRGSLGGAQSDATEATQQSPLKCELPAVSAEKGTPFSTGLLSRCSALKQEACRRRAWLLGE